MKIKAPRSLAQCLKKSSPSIIAVVASAGVVGTAILAIKATPKAIEEVKASSRCNHDGDPYAATLSEKVKSALPYYAPAIAMGVATIVCIMASNLLNRRQQASVAAAYNLISRQYDQYKKKTQEIYGRETHDRIMRELAVEKVDDDHTIFSPSIIGSGSLDFEDAPEERLLFYDGLSERYFESTIGKVLQAEYHLNRNLCLRGNVSLNEFYNFLDIEEVPGGDDIGWFIDDDEIYWIDFAHSKMEIDDGPDRSPIQAWIIDPEHGPKKPAENW